MARLTQVARGDAHKPRRTEEVGAAALQGLDEASDFAWLDQLPPSAVHVPLARLGWAEPAVREVCAHAERLGLDPRRCDLAQLIAAEYEIAHAHDARVTPADMKRAVERYLEAQQYVPSAASILFGFTYIVDEKVTLSPQLLSDLAQAASADPSGLGQDVLELVRDGPPPDRQGAVALVWPEPQTPQQLVASLIRQLVLGGAKSAPMNLRPELVDWLRAQLADVQTKRAMGGAGAFDANFAAAASADLQADFLVDKKVPREIAELFGPNVWLIDTDGVRHRPSEWVDPNARPRINFALQYEAGEKLFETADHRPLLWGERSLTMTYGDPPTSRERPLVTSDSGRVQLSTPSDEDPGFHASDEVLRKLGAEHDLVFIVGQHYYTKRSVGAEQAQAKSERLAHDLELLKEGHRERWKDDPDGRELIVHAQYVKAKSPELEPVMLGALAGVNDAHTLNAAEAPAVVNNMRAVNPALPPPPTLVSPDAKEPPDFMLTLAQQQLAALDVGMVRVRGMLGDVLAVRRDFLPDVAPEDFRRALLASRAYGAMKCANPSGELKHPQDIYFVAPLPEGVAVAASMEFADALGRQLALPEEAWDQVARDWFWVGPDETLYVFAPGRGLFDIEGGQISLGDTFDFGLWLALFAHPRAEPIQEWGC